MVGMTRVGIIDIGSPLQTLTLDVRDGRGLQATDDARGQKYRRGPSAVANIDGIFFHSK